jgi:serine/threonine-protein kinase
VVDGVVYVGSTDRYVYALEAATGEEIWRSPAGSLAETSPAVVGGVVYIASVEGAIINDSDDGYVYALDAATGEELWHFQMGEVVFASPVVVDGVVYIGDWDDYVYAITGD